MSAIDGRVLALVLFAVLVWPLIRERWDRAGDDLDRILAEHDEASERRWSE